MRCLQIPESEDFARRADGMSGKAKNGDYLPAAGVFCLGFQV
jgi:hypothetical protein